MIKRGQHIQTLSADEQQKRTDKEKHRAGLRIQHSTDDRQGSAKGSKSTRTVGERVPLNHHVFQLNVFAAPRQKVAHLRTMTERDRECQVAQS
jgi:hypothetical protein